MGEKRLMHHLSKWEEYILFIFMIIMLTVLAVQVFCRYALSFSFSWAEQLARVGFVWLTMAGISLAAQKGMHLKVDLMTQILPEKAAKYLVIFSDIFTMIFGLFMGWLILKTVLMQIRLNQVFSSIPWLPTWTMYIAGVLGMFGLSYRTTQRVFFRPKDSGE
jgi:TRAP-type C4-dicarboxylate transport system permease small subunit